MSNLSQVLVKTIAAETNIRHKAATTLDDATKDDFPGFIRAITCIIEDENENVIARQAGAIYLKNKISPADRTQEVEFANRWLSVPLEIKDQAKKTLFRALATPQRPISRNVAQCIASIAKVEVPIGQWPDLLATAKHILQFEAGNTGLVESTLETLGYIIEQIGAKMSDTDINEYLNIIITPLNAPCKDIIKESCLNSLMLCIPYLGAIMQSNFERDFLFKCPAQILSSSTNPDIYYPTLDYMSKLSTTYFTHFEAYAELYMPIIATALRSEDSTTVIHAIECLSAICDEESDRWESYQYGVPSASYPSGHPQLVPPPSICDRVFPFISDRLLELLKREDDSDDDDSWGPSQAAAVCLTIFAQYKGDLVAEKIYPFLQKSITPTNTDLYLLESGVMAFGSVLKGTKTATIKLIEDFLPTIMDIIGAPSILLQDTAAWAICATMDHVPFVLGSTENFEKILKLILHGLTMKPRVAAHFALSLGHIARHAYVEALRMERYDASPDENIILTAFKLDPYYRHIVDGLFIAGLRGDAHEKNLRQFSFESLNYLLCHTSNNGYQVIPEFLGKLLEAFSGCIARSQSHLSHKETQRLSSIEAGLCGLISPMFKILKDHDLAVHLEKLVTPLYSILNSSYTQSIAMEEAYLGMGALIERLGADFERIYPSYAPLLQKGINRTSEKTVCVVCVGQVSDITNLFGTNILEDVSAYALKFVQILNKPNVDKSVKPFIFSALGDIALLVKTLFKPLLGHSFMALASANILIKQYNHSKEADDIEFLTDLKDNTLDAYQSILIGLKGNDHSISDPEIMTAIEGQAPIIAELIELTFTSEYYSDPQLRSCLGILGEVISLFGVSSLNHFRCLFWFSQILQKGLASTDERTRTTAAWLQTIINEVR